MKSNNVRAYNSIFYFITEMKNRNAKYEKYKSNISKLGEEN